MKFLVENYASEYNTQALYLAKGLNEKEEHTCVLWNNSCSLYDIMDKEKPNYFITNAFRLSKDFLEYVNNSDFMPKDIKILLNVDDISQDIINSIESSLKKNNIKCPFFFSSDPNVKTKNVRFVNLNHAYDVYLSQKSNIQYKINKGIIVNSKEQIANYEGSYHILSQSKEMNDIADIVFPESQLCSLYHNYDEIIVNLDKRIPQVFFDAIIYGNKVYYKSSNADIKNDIQKMLRTDAILDYDDDSKITDFTEIKKIVLERHSSNNRIKTLLSQLPKD
jgi:hypothetical protein